MLSHPSSLIRAAPTPLRSSLRLAGFTRLGLAYLGRRTKEAPGLQTSLFHFLRSHVVGLTPGSARLSIPFSFNVRCGLPLDGRGSACIRVSSPGLSPKQDSPSNISPALFHEAAPFALCYNLQSRQTPLTGYDALFFTLSTSFPSYRT
jgi:hypothetical protein